MFTADNSRAPRRSMSGETKMTNHPNRAGQYELTFWGGLPNRFVEGYRRHHATLEAARAEAHRCLAELPNRSAHPAIIYGPQCGKDGLTIS